MKLPAIERFLADKWTRPRLDNLRLFVTTRGIMPLTPRRYGLGSGGRIDNTDRKW